MSDEGRPTPSQLAAVATAQAHYLDAQARRRGAVREALDAGCTYRQIAEAMRLSLSAVYNLGPNALASSESVGNPVGNAERNRRSGA